MTEEESKDMLVTSLRKQATPGEKLRFMMTAMAWMRSEVDAGIEGLVLE